MWQPQRQVRPDDSLAKAMKWKEVLGEDFLNQLELKRFSEDHHSCVNDEGSPILNLKARRVNWRERLVARVVGVHRGCSLSSPLMIRILAR